MTESTELNRILSEDAPKVNVFLHMQQRYLDQKLDSIRGKQSDSTNVVFPTTFCCSWVLLWRDRLFAINTWNGKTGSRR